MATKLRTPIALRTPKRSAKRTEVDESLFGTPTQKKPSAAVGAAPDTIVDSAVFSTTEMRRLVKTTLSSPSASRKLSSSGMRTAREFVQKDTKAEEEERKKKHKEKVRTKAVERVGTWNDTFEALAKKKADTLKNKAEAEERRREAIDEQERRVREEQRIQNLDRANYLRFLESDKVKTFMSNLYEADCIAERDLQIKLKDERQDLARRIREDAEEARVQAAIQQEKDDEANRKKIAREKATETREIRISQMAETQERRRKQKEEEEEEGRRIIEKAREFEEEQKRKEVERKEQQKRLAHITEEANADLRRLREEEKKKEEEEMQQIERYRQEKEKNEAQRRAEADEKEARKRKIRDQIMDEQVQRLAAWKDKEESRLHREEQELIQAQEAREKRDKDSMKKTLERLRVQREKQVAIQQARREAQLAEERGWLAEYEKTNERLRRDEENERMQKVKKAEELRASLREQVAAKKKIETVTAMLDRSEAEMNMTKEKNEDEMFDMFAETVINELQEQGKSTEPAVLVFRRMKQQEKTFRKR